MPAASSEVSTVTLSTLAAVNFYLCHDKGGLSTPARINALIRRLSALLFSSFYGGLREKSWKSKLNQEIIC